MGIYNSTLTRVKPLFEFIDSDIDKLNKLLSLFNMGKKLIIEEPLYIFYGKNEKKIAPPREILIWSINNIKKLKQVSNYGTHKNSFTYFKRKKLFDGNIQIKKEAIELLNKKNIPKSDWYIFEGYTHPDIYIETKDSIFIGEAKRTESNFTKSTTWLEIRDQFTRHIDSVLDINKKIYSFFLIEKVMINTENYKNGLKRYNEIDYYRSNMPHRDIEKIKLALKTYIGYLFWDDIAKIFNIPFPDTIST